VTVRLPHDLDAMAGAEAYNAWVVDRGARWIHGRVLDVGAGIGTHTSRLLPLADEVVALEPEAELAALLRQEHPSLTIVEGDATAVEGPFDAIVCFNVLEHIAADEGTLLRFRQLLAPDGTLLLLVPAHPVLLGSLDRAFGHERRYTKAELGRNSGGPGSRRSSCATSIRPAQSAGSCRRASSGASTCRGSGSPSTTGSCRCCAPPTRCQRPSGSRSGPSRRRRARQARAPGTRRSNRTAS
jgi:hypothetical protein